MMCMHYSKWKKYPEKSWPFHDFLNLDILTLVFTSLWEYFIKTNPIAFFTSPHTPWLLIGFSHHVVPPPSRWPLFLSRVSLLHIAPFPPPSVTLSSSFYQRFTVNLPKPASVTYLSRHPCSMKLVHFHHFDYQLMWQFPKLYFYPDLFAK